MVKFLDLMKHDSMAVLISFILGVGIAAMFRPLCKGPECIVFRGPPVNDIRNSVFQFGTRCVEFETKAVECPKEGAVDTVSYADYS